MPIAAVVLAAGASSRFGSPKQLAKLHGESLLERAMRLAREAGCAPVVVVLGAGAQPILAACELGDARVVLNEDWTEGMAASMRAGLRVLEKVDGCVVMTCDMPAVTAAHLRRLIGDGSEVAGSGYSEKQGIPAYFPSASFEALMALRGEVGARELLRSARCEELSRGELDIDTAEDLEIARTIF